MTVITTMLANLSGPLYWLGLFAGIIGVGGAGILFGLSYDYAAFSDKWAVLRRDARKWFIAGMAGIGCIFTSYAVYGINKPFVREVAVVKYEPIPYEDFMKACVPSADTKGKEATEAYYQTRQKCAQLAVEEMEGLVK